MIWEIVVLFVVGAINLIFSVLLVARNRKSKANVVSRVKGKSIKIGRLGAIIGDNAVVKKATIKPGVKIAPNSKVSGNVQENVN